MPDMLVVRDLAQVPEAARGAVFAIGNFDGVHRGHRVLIDRVKAIACEADRASGVIVFEPHPREFFQPDRPHFRLTPLNEKLRLFAEAGLDVAVVLDFDAQLAALDAEDFIAKVLVKGLGVQHVVVGYDFLFGRKRAGSVDTLRRAGQIHDFEVNVIDPQGEGGVVYSSSDVREALRKGEVRKAAEILGHWWRVRGIIIPGEKLGRTLGFPTANIELPKDTALAHGIYAVYVTIDGACYQGVAYFGRRPAVEGKTVLLEVFIFDFQGRLYGAQISVEFVDFVRGDMSFATLDELSSQIKRDCEKARHLLGGVSQPWA